MDAPTVAARPLTHKDLRLFVIGSMLPVFIGAMDNTILASALPTIGRDLGDVRNLTSKETEPSLELHRSSQ